MKFDIRRMCAFALSIGGAVVFYIGAFHTNSGMVPFAGGILIAMGWSWSHHLKLQAIYNIHHYDNGD